MPKRSGAMSVWHPTRSNRRRVEEFGREKEQYRGRRRLVSTLVQGERASPRPNG